MLEKVDLSKTMDKKELKTILKKESERLSVLQRDCRAANIPVMIVFEGLGAAGKGTQINRLIQPLDPRGFVVYSIDEESKEERRHPYLWRFWNKIPENGKIAIFDRSWYRRVLTDRFDHHIPDKEIQETYQDIRSFEEQLSDGGYVIIKLFLHISQKEQKKRFEKLLEKKETAWRVSDGDLKRNKDYTKYLRYNEEMLQQTDTDFAPWTIVEATEKDYAAVKIISAVRSRLQYELEQKRASHTVKKSDIPTSSGQFKLGALSGVDLTKTLDRDTYKEKLDKLQKHLEFLHSELYRLQIPVVLGFEGWDAGGKGGAIKRLTSHLDPRGYAVHPTQAPNDIEKAHHYLWRFWINMPKDGHIAIFDRTWYGRVMVERIEGFCREDEWKRAYQEINQMERHIANSGAVILKFWMHIDKDEQERRFMERQNTPSKQWKITDEDWRNREKWDQYEEAVNEMLLRTSSTYAPWIIVEGNSKYYARVKVLETVIQAIEQRIESADHGKKITSKKGE
ncbi:MAG: phosphate--AMP phosphotransferase [Lachnospiraceae bacterium]